MCVCAFACNDLDTENPLRKERFADQNAHKNRQQHPKALDDYSIINNCSIWAVCVVLKCLVKLIINQFFPFTSFHHISPVHVADQMNFEPRPSYPTENRDRTMSATRACCARRGLKREGSSHQVVCGQPQLSEHGRNISYRVKT